MNSLWIGRSEPFISFFRHLWSISVLSLTSYPLRELQSVDDPHGSFNLCNLSSPAKLTTTIDWQKPAYVFFNVEDCGV